MSQRLPANALQDYVADLLCAVGTSPTDAELVAASLVEADRMGIHSHGVMLLDMYLARIAAGSVRTDADPEIISDKGAALVLDARHGMGVLVARKAMDLAIGRAEELGMGIVSVRQGFHFGTARQFAQQAAERDCIGIAMCNTRPLMPAPGGATPVVGNNPLAIAVPVDGDVPLVLDMATSEAAMGKIRIAARGGKPIPPTWATDATGAPTTDADQAISGMLLPAAGPKGFGLALMIDLMCGILSGGSLSGQVQPLYGDASTPYDCSFVLIALDLNHFGNATEMRARAAEMASQIRNGPRAPGIERLYLPGEPEWLRARAADDTVSLPEGVATMLAAEGDARGIEVPQFLADFRSETV